MKLQYSIVSWIIVSDFLAWRGLAWKSEGTLPSTTSFAEYVGKFCFDFVSDDVDEHGATPTSHRAGLFEIDIRGEVESLPSPANVSDEPLRQLHFAVFDDEKHHWQRARPFWDELSCEERLELASWTVPLTSPLSRAPYRFQESIHVNQKIRPRFWYFTFINCGTTILQPLAFTVHATNPHQGFQAEFGMDVQGSLILEALFGCLFALLLVIICFLACGRSARLQHGSNRMPSLMRILWLSVVLSAAGCIFRACHHALFAVDGKGVLLGAVLGTAAACAAKALLAALQILLAKGWALLYSREERPQRYAIFVALTVVLGLSVACEIWEQYFHDHSTTFYLYESWPGRVMLVFNLCMTAAATRFMYCTYRRETMFEVRRFYSIVSAASGIYFFSLPVVCLLAELLNPWVRRKYVERYELAARFLATMLLVLCLRPSQVDSLVAARLKNREEPKLLSSDIRVEMEGPENESA